MFLLPARAVFQKKARQSDIAAKDGEIECGRIPVAATHRDRPAVALKATRASTS